MRKGRAKDRDHFTRSEDYGDTLVTKFVNNLMQDGKKSSFLKIFYEAMDIVEAKTEEEWFGCLEEST